MKIKTIILVFIGISSNLLAQSDLKQELISTAIYKDSIVFEINKKLFVDNSGEIINCEPLNKASQILFQSYFKSIDDHYPIYLLSYKNVNDSLHVLTALHYGKYSPILTLFSFEKDFEFVQAIDLESSFVDAGTVEIYKTHKLDQQLIERSFLTEWEKHLGDQGYTVTDSTVTTFQLLNSGIIKEMKQEKYKRVTKWK